MIDQAAINAHRAALFVDMDEQLRRGERVSVVLWRTPEGQTACRISGGPDDVSCVGASSADAVAQTLGVLVLRRDGGE